MQLLKNFLFVYGKNPDEPISTTQSDEIPFVAPVDTVHTCRQIQYSCVASQQVIGVEQLGFIVFTASCQNASSIVVLAELAPVDSAKTFRVDVGDAFVPLNVVDQSAVAQPKGLQVVFGSP